MLGGVEWEKVRASVELRNRIVHPETVDQLEISDDEFEGNRIAIEWLSDAFADLINDLEGHQDNAN
ncbi:hypothetical protein D3C72_2237220 [compost metagenome]